MFQSNEANRFLLTDNPAVARRTATQAWRRPCLSWSVVTAATVAFLACAPPAEEARPNDQTVRAELDSMWAGLAAAMLAADTGRVAHFYVDSAVMAETGSPTLRGRTAILAATAAVFQCCAYRESRPTIERTDIAGSRAVQFGTYRDVLEPRGEPPLAMYGRFEAVVDRDSSSAWKVRRMVVIRDSMVKLPTRGPR